MSSVQPVTQQYLKRFDGSYALIDMYFPQINFAIECDEAFHKENLDRDRIRELSMEEALDSFQETSGFVLRRIDVDQDIEGIDNQINTIVREIGELFSSKIIEEWDINENPSQIVLDKGSISISDPVRFNTILEITRCFGKHYKGMQLAYFSIDEKNMLWCPNLSEEIEGKMISTGSHGWINYLSSDWRTIFETRDKLDKMTGLEKQGYKPRITFAHSRNPFGRRVYRFIGVFEFSNVDSSHELRVYKRISDKISLTKEGAISYNIDDV